MSEQASFCDMCHSIAHEIDVYYRHLKDISNSEKQHHASLKERRPFRDIIALGTLEDLQSKSRCKSCQDIAHLILRYNQPSAETVFRFEFHPQQGLFISTDPWSNMFFELSLWRIGEAEKAYEVGRIFNTQQINMDLLRQWIRCCDLSHQDRCIVTGLPLPMHHIYLVDVEEGCLVHAAANARYIALSYVWGDNQTVQTTKSNLANFQKPKSIGADVSSVKIANTIRDALRLVSLLGERYLWVDCLCIVQDDVDTKQLHLNSMASIYSNAHFTIVAADGQNADYGLRGFAGSTEARAVRWNIVRYPYETDMILSRPQDWYPEGSPWSARGWTFQESLFSRRLLIFNGMVSWYCRRAVWQEHVNSPTEDEAYAATHEPHELRTHLAADYPTWPDLYSWAGMVQEFNKRKLTYDEDVIDAFSGITSVFNRQFSGGILWGIPEMFFDHCIIWRPRTILRRRASNYSLSNNILPSWSWVGWKGEVVLRAAPPILDDHPRHDDRSITIKPVVRWYKSMNPTSALFPIKNIYHSLQHMYSSNQAKQVPIGWTRAVYSDGTSYYKHDRVPFIRFRYPMPLASEDLDPIINDQCRYLHFRSQRAWLFVGQGMMDSRKGWTTSPASLVDKEGNWAGTIRLNMSQSDLLPTGRACELIALSLASAVNSGDYKGVLDEWTIPERPDDSELYRFYYVMWIEWEDGIAYRKAVGTVYKDIWESQVREDVDVILG